MISYLKSNRWRLFSMATVMMSLLFSACQKDEVKLQDPYAGGKASLGIEFISKAPVPAIASPGDQVELKVKGLKKYEGKFILYVNELPAHIDSLTDDLIIFTVPDNASTGGIWVTLNDASANLDNQTYFGPGLQIDGKVNIDKTFAVVNGSNSTIYDVQKLGSGNFLLAGSFDDYENTKTSVLSVGRLIQVTPLAAIDNSLKFGLGANGSIYSVARVTSGDQNGKLLIAGNFSSFNSKRSNRININGITRLNIDGTLDSTYVDVVNLTPNDPGKNRDTVPAFNGGVFNINGSRGLLVRRIFSFNNMVYAVGNFDKYGRAFYERSTYDSKVIDYTTIRQIVRMQADGAMDSTYRFNVADKTSPLSSNGNITDATQLADGSLIIVGDFTNFDGMSQNRIVHINTDGTLDQSFAAGTGANNEISSVTYNANTNKILVAGKFTTFNGQSLSGVALLNVDGSLSNNFTFPSLGGGVPTFAGQLNSGKIIVAGGFNRYNEILRQGFMVLNTDGTLAQGYNNTGVFTGTIYDMVEGTSDAGNPAVILVGNIIRFNNNTVHNIVKVELQN